MWRTNEHLLLGLPMVLQLVIFWYWSNIVLKNIQTDPNDFEIQLAVCRVSLLVTAVYLSIFEIMTFLRRKLNYLKESPENLLNILTPLLILWNVVGNNVEEYSFWMVQTYAALSIWFRFLFYLRTFETFNKFVNMILQSMLRVVPFLIIFLIGVFAFCDAFLSIETSLTINGLLEPV